MNDNDTIARLVELHDHIAVPVTPPGMDVLRGQRLLRRRRTVSVVATAAAVLLTVGVVQAALSDGRRAVQPAPQPSPSHTETPVDAEEWTPDRIRAEGSVGDPQGAIPATASGLSTRLYEVCDGSKCSREDGFEDLHVAIEVAQGGNSAVFDLRWTGQPWVEAFDEDSVLVQDSHYPSSDEPVRYRLLHADGSSVELELTDLSVPALPGPSVVVIDDWGGWNGGMAGMEEIYVVDDRAGTLDRLDVPAGARYWGPNVNDFIWGVSDDCRVFWARDGDFDNQRLDCSPTLGFTAMPPADEFPPGWLQPGRMVLWEQSDVPGQNDQYLHVSLDSGATWERFPLADGESAAAVLQQAG